MFPVAESKASLARTVASGALHQTHLRGRALMRIRCLAHVINLATKALIAAYGDPKNRPGSRNEIDVVRDIAVKVCCALPCSHTRLTGHAGAVFVSAPTDLPRYPVCSQSHASRPSRERHARTLVLDEEHGEARRRKSRCACLVLMSHTG